MRPGINVTTQMQPNIDVLGVETAKSAQNVIVSGEDAIRYAARNAVGRFLCQGEVL